MPVRASGDCHTCHMTEPIALAELIRTHPLRTSESTRSNGRPGAEPLASSSARPPGPPSPPSPSTSSSPVPPPPPPPRNPTQNVSGYAKPQKKSSSKSNFGNTSRGGSYKDRSLNISDLDPINSFLHSPRLRRLIIESHPPEPKYAELKRAKRIEALVGKIDREHSAKSRLSQSKRVEGNEDRDNAVRNEYAALSRKMRSSSSKAKETVGNDVSHYDLVDVRSSTAKASSAAVSRTGTNATSNSRKNIHPYMKVNGASPLTDSGSLNDESFIKRTHSDSNTTSTSVSTIGNKKKNGTIANSRKIYHSDAQVQTYDISPGPASGLKARIVAGKTSGISVLRTFLRKKRFAGCGMGPRLPLGFLIAGYALLILLAVVIGVTLAHLPSLKSSRRTADNHPMMDSAITSNPSLTQRERLQLLGREAQVVPASLGPELSNLGHSDSGFIDLRTSNHGPTGRTLGSPRALDQANAASLGSNQVNHLGSNHLRSEASSQLTSHLQNLRPQENEKQRNQFLSEDQNSNFVQPGFRQNQLTNLDSTTSTDSFDVNENEFVFDTIGDRAVTKNLNDKSAPHLDFSGPISGVDVTEPSLLLRPQNDATNPFSDESTSVGKPDAIHTALKNIDLSGVRQIPNSQVIDFSGSNRMSLTTGTRAPFKSNSNDAGDAKHLSDKPLGTNSIPEVKIVRSWSNSNPDGTFSYGYLNTDGSFKNETRGHDCVVQGVYGYVDPETGVTLSFPYKSGNPCTPGTLVHQPSEQHIGETRQHITTSRPFHQPVFHTAHPPTFPPPLPTFPPPPTHLNKPTTLTHEEQQRLIRNRVRQQQRFIDSSQRVHAEQLHRSKQQNPFTQSHFNVQPLAPKPSQVSGSSAQQSPSFPPTPPSPPVAKQPSSSNNSANRHREALERHRELRNKLHQEQLKLHQLQLQQQLQLVENQNRRDRVKQSSRPTIVAAKMQEHHFIPHDADDHNKQHRQQQQPHQHPTKPIGKETRDILRKEILSQLEQIGKEQSQASVGVQTSPHNARSQNSQIHHESRIQQQNENFNTKILNDDQLQQQLQVQKQQELWLKQLSAQRQQRFEQIQQQKDLIRQLQQQHQRLREHPNTSNHHLQTHQPQQQ
ncbi:hypothetical protein FHG87_002388 [Trinorchestia longiramus]|nr:hypothetical protein FHG87_002388 [Trinorchestia longiramus]